MLEPKPVVHLIDVVDRAIAVAATATSTAYTALHARLRGFRPEFLDRHLYETRDLVKVHAFRGSFFVVRRSLLGTALAASAPGRERVCRAYRRHHNVSEARWREWGNLALKVLGDGAMDARELARGMGGEKLPPTFLRMLSVEGSFVPWTPGSSPGWESATHRLASRAALFPEADPSGIDAEAAQADLLRRYFEAYGPASVKDAAWWLDANATRVNRLLGGGFRGPIEWTMDVDTGQELVGVHGPAPHTRRSAPPVLLPGADHVPRAFRERDFFLRREWYDQVVTRDGNIRPSVWVDGEIRGRWRVVHQGGRAHVVVWQFERFPPETRKALAPRAHHMARFAGAIPGTAYFEDYPSGLPASGGKPPLPKELRESSSGQE